ncbi:hypothetical protein [Winogradskyella alexanderae]|uniref:Secreted protein n=1 Tax=Winogradskyella alexanderae TaxID=2877123 RepID=A0ABS7XR68_9FLAO|nr:hypothetical protein [Winogradskyella alexanderae]MCA0131933.1 hypothetical protein [Winogradskyella alexanderae]
MKTHSFKFQMLPLLLVVFLIFPILAQGQAKRMKPPKRISKVKSVDLFVGKSFDIYNKVYVYDSLSQKGYEIPVDLEEELIERTERDLDSLWQITPDLWDDISEAPFIKQAKATINLKKASKALKYCLKTAKAYVLGNDKESYD